MRVCIYSVRDLVVREYHTPFTAGNDATAVRMFVNGGRNPDAGMGLNPSDFELWRIGEFDPESGEVFDADHVRLGKLVDLQPKTNGAL